MHNRNLRNTLVGVAFAALAGVAWWGFSQPAPTQPVVFEVRAIDPTGHPVAGAEVWLKESKVGVTDSFGVWRRTMRVDSDAEATLHFRKRYSALDKRHAAGEYSGEKSFMVRHDDAQRIQNHRGSLQLMPARI